MSTCAASTPWLKEILEYRRPSYCPAARRLPRGADTRRGLLVRHRDPQRRRRVHLWRGDRDLQLDRGVSRRATREAAVPGRARAVRQADDRQQRRDAHQRARGAADWGRRVRADWNREVDRAQAVLLVGPHRSARRVRGDLRRDTRRAARAGAGGVPGGRSLQAVLLGGAAGGFVTPDQLDMPLTFEAVREAGATLGSGVVVPFDDTVDLRDILTRIAAFMRDESCGQCTPCRVGTVRQEEALARLVSDTPGAASRTSWPCWGSWRRACAILQSVASARLRPALSARRSIAWACSRRRSVDA